MSRHKEELKGHLEDAVKNLAVQRAMILKLDEMTEEEVTDFINEVGEKYAKKYEKMEATEILLEAIAEAILDVQKMKERREDDD